LGVGRSAVAMFIARHPALKEIANECRETMKDLAEEALHEAVLNGEQWAIKMVLNGPGRDRGYGAQPAMELEDVATEEPAREVIVRTRQEASAMLALPDAV